MTSTCPSLTRSPTETQISFTTPPKGQGISIEAFSLSMLTSESPGSTLSPTETRISMTSAFSTSPMSGTRTSLSTPKDLLLTQTVTGFGFRGSMSYFLKASATVERSMSPESASAVSAATATK